MTVKDDILRTIHAASCEDSLSECIEWGGVCAKSVDRIFEHYGIVDLVDLGETRVWTFGASVEIGDSPASVSIDVPNWIVDGRSILDLSTPVVLREIASVLLTAANRAGESQS